MTFPSENIRQMKFTVMPRNRRKLLDFCADLFFACATIYCLSLYLRGILTWQGIYSLSLGSLVVTLIVVALVHSLKGLRFYLIMLDYSFPLPVFLNLYAETALVNLLLPYKAGEIYRGLRAGRAAESFLQGYASVLFDRFVDTLALVTVIIGFSFLAGTGIPATCAFFAAFAFFIAALYWFFPSLDRFWQHYLLFNRSSENTLRALYICQLCHRAYDRVYTVVRGRFVLLYLMSVTAWFIEIGGLLVLGGKSSGSGLEGYLSAVLLGHPVSENSAYILLCFFMLTLLAIYSRCGKGGRNG